MGVARMLALLVIAALFLPNVRPILLVVVLSMVGILVLFGLVKFVRLLTRLPGGKTPFPSPKPRLSIPASALLSGPAAPALESFMPVNEPALPTTIDGLVKQLHSIDWFQFEKLAALVYRKLGYGVTRRGGGNPDGGIDLVIEKDGQRSAVQCKQWKTWNVGVKAVREFLGALTDSGIRKGVFITLCGYTGEAKRLAEKHGIEIVNEVGLAQMLEKADALSDPETLDILSDRRKFCPKCESEMVLRTAGRGVSSGQQFWGCSAYPRCHFTMPIE